MAFNLDSATDFAGGAFNVTLSDSADQDNKPFALWITASTGNVKVKTADGDTCTFAVPAAGTIPPFAVLRVYSTGTTVSAANIIGIRFR